MRTVDPEQWSKKLVKRPLNVVRPWRFRVDVLTRFEQRLRSSFCNAMEEFLGHRTVAARIVDKRESKLVRRCYLLLVAISLGTWLVAVHAGLAVKRESSPLAMSLQAAVHPAQEVDFPAVALCSYNTISSARLNAYATYLYSLEKNNSYSMAQLKKNLMSFSGLFSTTHVPFDANFTQYLARVAREDNVTNIIYKLAPRCEFMLERCAWRGRRINCQRLFATRITDVGYCCVFNGRYSAEDHKNPPYRVNMVGQDFGLLVVIKENTDDFTYVRRTGEELEMLLFDGKQYPLMKAGVVRTYALQRNSSVFVALTAHVQRVTEALRLYTEAWRGCVMPATAGEPRVYWAQCVAECRRQAVLALCQCTPHTKPVSNRSANDIICSLEHMACLDKYKDKLSSFYPGEHGDESLSEEKADSVECLHCLSNCALQRYAAQVWTIPYGELIRRAFHNKFVEGLSLVNGTVVRIYFSGVDQPLYQVEASLLLYEVISLLSNLSLLVAGITMSTFFELVYCCTIRWRHYYKRLCHRDDQLSKLNKL